MSLAERLKAPPERLSGTDCSLGRLLRTLEGPELDALLVMLGTDEERGWSQNEIYNALVEEGHDVARQTINRHRAKGCRCFRQANR